MHFSFHKTKQPFNAATVHRDWVAYEGFKDLSKAIIKVPISPIVFKQGRRAEPYFSYSDLLALDFDDGPTIWEMFNKIKDSPHIIATTKTHQKDKHGIVCDRFRVIIPFKRRITCVREYRATMTHYIETLGADGACKDGGRFFFPCSSIVSFKESNWNPFYFADVYEAPRKIETNRDNLKRFETRQNGEYKIPKFILDFATMGIPFGSGRNGSFFSAARRLAEDGVPDDQIFDLLIDAPISETKWGQNERKTAITRGIKYGR